MYAKVQHLPMVNRSVTLCQVAREIVAESIENKNSNKECILALLQKLKVIDQSYLEAYMKVTKQPENEAKEKLEYKLLHFSTEKITSMKEQSAAGLQKICCAKEQIKERVEFNKKALIEQFDSHKKGVTQILISSRDRFSNTFDVKIKSAESNLATIKSKSVCLTNTVKEGVKTRCLSAKNTVTEQAERAIAAAHLKDLLAVIGDKYSKLNSFTKEEAAHLKSGLSKVFGFLTNKVQSSEVVNFVVKSSKTQIEHFKNALEFLKETCHQNAGCIRKLADRNAKFAETFASKNTQILKYVQNENKKLVNNYFRKFEIEMYYSPEESIKFVEKLKGLVRMLWGGKLAEEKQEPILASDPARLIA